MIACQYIIIPKWKILNYDNYIVADNNQIYNIKTKKKLQMQLKGYIK